MAESIKFVVCDPIGLHARPATILVNKANRFSSAINIIYNGEERDLKSIMNVMALSVPTRAVVEIVAEGEDAKEAVNTILKAVKETHVGEEC